MPNHPPNTYRLSPNFQGPGNPGAHLLSLLWLTKPGAAQLISMDGETFACNSSRLVPLGLFSEKPSSFFVCSFFSWGCPSTHPTIQLLFGLHPAGSGGGAGLPCPPPPAQPQASPLRGVPLQGSDLEELSLVRGVWGLGLLARGPFCSLGQPGRWDRGVVGGGWRLTFPGVLPRLSVRPSRSPGGLWPWWCWGQGEPCFP